MSGCGCDADGAERRTLRFLLAINGAMFVVEGAAGWQAESMGLLADALDMLADAFVYGVALWAVGSGRRQSHAAAASGLLQLALALGVVLETGRRFVHGSEPMSLAMIGVSLVALAANVACVALLRRHKDGGVHMRASWIFSTTDVLANLGVMAAGGLVLLTGSAWPDLVIGLLVCGLVVRGGVRILAAARLSYAAPTRLA